ncbi:MAG: S-layer homology domain-containing protein [Bacillota bacterium]|nr:S-layer homology domain-containing protein [Bacillota bacterium]
MKRMKRFIAPLLALVMVISFAFGVTAAEINADDASNSYVYLTMEKFTLGQECIFAPIAIPWEEGMTAASILVDKLGDDNYQCSGSLDGGDLYISAVKDPDQGSVDMPKVIYDAVMGSQNVISARNEKEWLGEFDYYNESGWMLTVNDDFIGTSSAAHTLQPGDVVRWQFTVYGLGADLGNSNESFGGYDKLIDAANKDDLVKSLANATQKNTNAYKNAYSVLVNAAATQAEVDTAKANLDANADVPLNLSSCEKQHIIFTNGLQLSATELQLAPKETEKLTAVVTPDTANFSEVVWKSSRKAVATVSADGTVTAVGEGTAKITATTKDGGASAVCEVAVKKDDAPVEIKLPFSDVQKKDWFYTDVLYVYENEIMNGVSNTVFGPNDDLTRGQFVAILGRYAGIKDSSKGSPASKTFDDVKTTEYYASHVKWAIDQGITNGVSEKNFAPKEKITREQMAAMMYRYAKAIGVTLPGADSDKFSDDNKISSYAKDAVYSMKAAGILGGMGNNTFAPKGNTTRAQAAKVIHVFMEL